MYTIKMTIHDAGGIVDSTVLYSVASRGVAFALMAEWSNFLKQSIKDLIEKGKGNARK